MDCLDKFEERLNYEEAKLLSGAERIRLIQSLIGETSLCDLKDIISSLILFLMK